MSAKTQNAAKSGENSAGLSAAEQAIVEAAVQASARVSQETARKIVETMSEEVQEKAREVGEAAAKAAAEKMVGASVRSQKVEKGSKIAYYLTGALFFGGSIVTAAMTAYKARKSGVTMEGITSGAETGRTSRGR